MLNWAWNIEHFEAKGIRLNLIHPVTLKRQRKKPRELDLQWTVALGSQGASVYQACLQCSCRAVPGHGRSPAGPMSAAGFAQQRPARPGSGRPHRSRAEGGSGLSLTARAQIALVTLHSLQSTIMPIFTYVSEHGNVKHEVRLFVLFLFVLCHVCFVGDIGALYYSVYMLMEKVYFSSGFANISLEYCRSCLSNKVFMVKYECLLLKMWIKLAAKWQCWEPWKGWRCFFKLQVRKHCFTAGD